MDHRCLYGHRIPEQFTFAIQQRVCPTCGAPCVTLEGYRLARRLAQDVPLEALAAFNVVRILEMHYALTPRAGGEAPPESNRDQEGGSGEEPPITSGGSEARSGEEVPPRKPAERFRREAAEA